MNQLFENQIYKVFYHFLMYISVIFILAPLKHLQIAANWNTVFL